MVSIVTYLWKGNTPGREFLPEHVTTLARSFKRTLSIPHRFICISDVLGGFGPEVEVIPTPPAARLLGALRSPEGGRFPSCYRRLWTFSADAKEALGDRVLLTDIDLVVIRDMTHLLNRPEDFVGWRPRASWGKSDRVGGGMYLLRTGTRQDVYTRFSGQASILQARSAGYRGSDQAWISYALGRVPVWPVNSGLYSIRDMGNGRLPLPKDAVAVQFNGPVKPWCSKLAWVKENFK